MNVSVDPTPPPSIAPPSADLQRIYPVILSGGAGTRLWPLSRATFPKQLLPLLTERSMIQETVARTHCATGFVNPIIVCNREHRHAIEDQLRNIGCADAHIIMEPEGRNTGPAVTAAAVWLAEHDPDGVMLVQPSDHVIGSVAAFHDAIARGMAAARAGWLVTFGIIPTRAETGFGYIRVGSQLEESDAVYHVDRFAEKPNRKTAEDYLASGEFMWNSGIFLFSAQHYLAEIERLTPEILRACQQAYIRRSEFDGHIVLDESAFAAAPDLSVDRAVLETTARAAVVPVEMAWNDVGTWTALRDTGDPDVDGNVVHGDVMLSGVHNSYVRSDDRLVAVIGVEDLVVVSTDDAILVSTADRAAEVTGMVEHLRRSNRPETMRHKTMQRPWGYYRTTDQGERFQVKRIVVKPGARLSLQKHYHRAEHWVVVRGTAIVQRGADQLLLRENESTYISPGIEHRLENPGKIDLHLIEVQSGPYLGEDDIVRIADNYGRV